MAGQLRVAPPSHFEQFYHEYNKMRKGCGKVSYSEHHKVLFLAEITLLYGLK